VNNTKKIQVFPKEAFGAVFLDPIINHDCLNDINKIVVQ
jgi:hypothetical protein